MEEKRFYTIQELQEVIGCGKSTAYKLVKEGGMPHIFIGRKIYIPIKGFEKWSEERVCSTKREKEYKK